MAKINAALLGRLIKKMKVGQARVYQVIQRRALDSHVDSHVASLLVARDNGVNYQPYATPEDRAEMRHASGSSHAPTPPPSPPVATPAARPADKKLGKTKVRATKDNSMFVVHGRDAKLNQDMYAFLASIGIVPMEWDHAIKAAKGGANPIVGDVISQAMDRVQGVMILFSPDEEAKIRTKFASQGDKNKGHHLKGFQPRPNVIFEAGLALGAHSEKTILVQVGVVRDISDIAGKHMVQLSNSFADRKRLADRLESKLKFKIDLTGTTWQTIGNFDRQ
jgi:predicted nucleotide-binding protein